jgi:hypothetical protein
VILISDVPAGQLLLLVILHYLVNCPVMEVICLVDLQEILIVSEGVVCESGQMILF